jgi:ABC-type transport system involved in multi-copper enzyme maturation permease subunit
MNSMFISASLAIAKSTFLEMTRDKIIYASLLFACLLCSLGLLLGSVSIGQDARITLDFGVAAMTLIAGVLATFSGSLAISREFERRTIYWILVRPVRPWQFILGKYLGIAATLLMIISLMGLFMVLALAATTGGAIFKDLPLLFGGFALIYLEIAFIAALAIVFSTFAEPIMAVIFTLSFWLIGHEVSSLNELAKMSTNGLLSNLASVLYFLLPDLETLTRTRTLIMSGGNDQELCTYLVAYTITYVIILLTAAAIVIEHKELP